MSNRSLPFLTPEILLRAYASGIFPMAENADSTELHWFDPPIRAIIPLDDHFHIPRRLKRTIRQRPFTIKLDTAFSKRDPCLRSETADGRHTTWINREIKNLYSTLYWARPCAFG